MKKGWKIFWTVIISLTGAGVVFCIIALCLGVTFSQFEKAYPNGIGIIRKDYVSFEGDRKCCIRGDIFERRESEA